MNNIKFIKPILAQCTGTSCSVSINSPFGNTLNSGSIFSSLFNLFYFVVGIVFIVIIITSGIRIIVSNGNRERVAKAQTTLMYAIIGLVLIVFAGIIIKILSTALPLFNGLI
jgi:ABC-type polysaccharide transport system permease subunit